MSVRDIQYLNRDFCTLFSKPIVYLHYVSNMDKYPNASYQYVLKKEPFNEKSTNEKIIDEFKTYESSTINASKKCKVLTFVKDFQTEYSGIIDDIKTFPDYTVTVSNISNRNDTCPDVGLVWEINKISPRVCGMLFENMISHALGIDDKCWDLSGCMTDMSSNVETKTIIGIIERNFIKRHLMNRGRNVKINSKNIVYVGDEKICENDFISVWHYLVYLSLRHFIKHDLKGEDFEDCLKILDFINANVKYMDEYYFDLCDSTFMKNLSRETNLKHGEIYRTAKLHGEVDFISDAAITDIKAYKSNDVDNCFFLYEKLAGKKQHLRILNVYTNEVFEFTYNNDEEIEEENEDTVEEETDE